MNSSATKAPRLKNGEIFMIKLAWLIALALLVGSATGCRRKPPEKPPEPTPPATGTLAQILNVPPEPTQVTEHITAQALTDDLVLYTLRIEFETDQAVILPAYFADLDKIGRALTRNPTATARIEGHADRRHSSTPDHNARLSRQRAAAVAEYLKTKTGLATNRLTSVGFGFSRPLEPNHPVNGSSRNRRVEIYISKDDAAPNAPAATNAPGVGVAPPTASLPGTLPANQDKATSSSNTPPANP
jgi:outer membrane protein OmpA-like peptidoglycan-associated protein